MKFVGIVTTVVAALSLSSAQASLTVPFKGCKFYEHADYEGHEMVLRDGERRRVLGVFWNDRISSVINGRQCVAMVYEHINYTGLRRGFERRVAYVGNFWNDRISAIECICDVSG